MPPEFNGYNSPWSGPTPQIAAGPGYTTNPPRVVTGRNQAERWLAAETIDFTGGPGNGFTITLQANTAMWVDLNRLCLQAGSVDSSGGGNSTPTGSDFNSLMFVSSILIKGSTELMRGQGTPLVSFATWSPLRAFNTINLLARGSWLRLQSNETVSITAEIQDAIGAGDEQSKALCAVPCILDCDKGKPAYTGFSQSQGSAVIGSALQTVNGVNPQVQDVDMFWIEDGITDLARFVVAQYGQTDTATDGNVATRGWALSGITSIQTVSRDELVVGNSFTGNLQIEVPLACYTVPAMGTMRKNPWARLPSQQGSNGSSVLIALNSRALSNNKEAISSAPFYPTSGGPLKDCPELT